MLSEMLTEDYALQWIRIVTTVSLDMLIMITANMLVTMQGKILFLFLSSGEGSIIWATSVPRKDRKYKRVPLSSR